MKKRHWYLLAACILISNPAWLDYAPMNFLAGMAGGALFGLWGWNLFEDSRRNPSTVSKNWEVVASTGPPPSTRDRKVMDQMLNHVLKTGKPCCGEIDDDGNLHIKDIDQE